MRFLLASAAAFALSACSGGNLSQPTRPAVYAGPAVAHPYHNPGARSGDVPAVWLSPAADGRGTIVRLRDPRVEGGIPDYDNAPWLAGKRPASAPEGTF